MIKDINRNEISQLKNNLIEIEKLKNSMFTINDYKAYIEGRLNLDKATEFYQSVKTSKVNIKAKEDINKCMVNYLYSNKIIGNEMSEFIISNFINYDKNHIQAIYDGLIKLFESICCKLNIEMGYDYNSNIIENDDIAAEFYFIQRGLRYDVCAFSDLGKEEEEEVNIDEIDYTGAMEEVFQDDAIVFCFKNITISNSALKLIENWIPDTDIGFVTEVYNHEENLYLDISENYIFDGMSAELLLNFICSLLKKE